MPVNLGRVAWSEALPELLPQRIHCFLGLVQFTSIFFSNSYIKAFFKKDVLGMTSVVGSS